MSRSAAALPIVAALLTGCAGGLGVDDPLGGLVAPGETPVVTDRIVLELVPSPAGLEGRIGLRIENRTDRHVSISNCRGLFGLRLEKRVGGDWVSAWGPALPMCLSAPIVIVPGDAHQHELTVFDGRRTGAHPRFEGDDIPGVYRVVIESLYWSYDHDGPPWGEPLPLDQRVSNTFEIRVR